MLSRRENLLIVPWQKRRYLDHRRKIQSALPAIDVKTPESRNHVLLKQKKIQREFERCKKIEHDNFILLKHLNKIMETCRVDNVWEQPPPDFLHRIEMFKVKRKENTQILKFPLENPKNRKERCMGCTPDRFLNEIYQSEERIPYEPPKPRLSRRRSSTLASEEMKKEAERIDSLEYNRKKQNINFKQFHQSSPLSSQRTNSIEINQNSNRSNNILPRNNKEQKMANENQNKKIDKKSNRGHKTKLKQIELNKDSLELVLIFPSPTSIPFNSNHSVYHSVDFCEICTQRRNKCQCQQQYNKTRYNRRRN